FSLPIYPCPQISTLFPYTTLFRSYEDTYILKVMAKNYHGTEVEVDLNNDVDLDIELEPFYTVPGGEIAYDDGVADNARAFYDAGDRKSTRLNSSHVSISYAVFCLK